MRPAERDADDLETARLLAMRSEDGLRRLLKVHAPRVIGALRREFGAAVDDAMFDAAISDAAYCAWRSIATFSATRGSLGAWFYVIARHATLRVLAEEKRQQRLAFEGEAVLSRTAEPADLPDVDHGAIDKLWRCVLGLPPLQRAIVEADLAAGEVASAAELAAEWNTTANSIYVSRRLAHVSLRRALERLGFTRAEN